MAFWTTGGPGGVEPKRNFKFLLSIQGGVGTQGGIQEFLVQKVAKPSMETTATEHSFLNHYFYFPGKSKWNAIEATIIDLVQPSDGNMSQVVMNMVQAAGYQLPTSADSQNALSLNVMAKNRAVSALGDVKIKTLDFQGNTVETWVLKQAWIQKFSFSEADYGNEELSTCTMTFQYDFAYLENAAGVRTPGTSPVRRI